MKERADEERREKRNKLKERKDDFRQLLESASLTGKSTFTEFCSKFSKEDRFKNIEKMRERESLFDEYLLDVRRKEKEEKQAKREQVCGVTGIRGHGNKWGQSHSNSERIRRTNNVHVPLYRLSIMRFRFLFNSIVTEKLKKLVLYPYHEFFSNRLETCKQDHPF